MFVSFKEKYRLALENYITYKAELDAGLKAFDSPDAKDPKFKAKVAELASELRASYPMSLADVTSTITSLDGMSIGSYVSSFGYSIYGGANHFAICASIGALASFWNSLLKYLEEDDSVNDVNYMAKVDAFYAKAEGSVERAALDSSKGREFYAAVSALGKDGASKYCASACYPRELIAGMERLLALYPEIEALDPSLEGMDGINQFRRFRNEIYDAIIEVQGRFNDFPEESARMSDYFASLAKELNDLPEEFMEEARARATELAAKDLDEKVKNYLSSENAPTVNDKLLKKLERDRLAVIKYCSKMNSKGKEVNTFKVMKLSGHTIYMRDCDKPGLSLVTSYDAMNVAMNGSAADYIDLYKTACAKLHFYKNGDPAAKLYEEHLEKIVADKKADLAVGTPLSARREFINDVFTPFYVFVGAPLLDAMFELVYMDTFRDFTVLPDEFKTKTALDDLCEYFRMKRADTVKEAINLYVSECGYPEQDKLPNIDKAETAATIAAMMLAEDYLASMPKKASAAEAIKEAIG